MPPADDVFVLALAHILATKSETLVRRIALKLLILMIEALSAFCALILMNSVNPTEHYIDFEGNLDLQLMELESQSKSKISISLTRFDERFKYVQALCMGKRD